KSRYFSYQYPFPILVPRFPPRPNHFRTTPYSLHCRYPTQLTSPSTVDDNVLCFFKLYAISHGREVCNPATLIFSTQEPQLANPAGNEGARPELTTRLLALSTGRR